MSTLDTRREADLRGFADDLAKHLGSRLVSIVLYGSAAGDDWVSGTSDLNTAVVLEPVDVAGLDTLAPILARWRKKGFALPLVVDREYLRRARESFPMEIEDIRCQHRVVAGEDPFADLQPDETTLRRELEQEAFGKLLRLRALYLENAESPKALEHLMLDSVKSFLILLRHLVRLRTGTAPGPYGDVLAAGEKLLGPLPAIAELLARRGGRRLARGTRELSRDYLADVERIVHAVSSLP